MAVKTNTPVCSCSSLSLEGNLASAADEQIFELSLPAARARLHGV
jgi:hypothetical protein